MERTGQVTATVALRVIILDLHALDDLSGDTAPYQPVRALARGLRRPRRPARDRFPACARRPDLTGFRSSAIAFPLVRATLLARPAGFEPATRCLEGSAQRAL
jgi:hypothetical protein